MGAQELVIRQQPTAIFLSITARGYVSAILLMHNRQRLDRPFLVFRLTP